MTKKDDAISQIREVRHIISEENGHDPQRLVNYYIELQKQYPQLTQLKENQTELVQAS
ncbi:MAG: hypothetical protein HC769_37890 [Cyanobacteria bacterium CRU_2_1]|nr:hypothetical protein [Cyanobacteria bacterium CRU_2_1]